jgi:hypothetical protein
MPALSSTREGYLQSPIRETGSFLVLAFRSGFECGQFGPVLLAPRAVTVVTAVTNFWRGSRPMVGIHVSLLWCVSVVWTEGGTADFLVTVVTVVM